MVLFNPLSLQRVGRKEQLAKCFSRQHIVALAGTQLSTCAWHQTQRSGRFFFIDWGKPRGRSEVSAGVSLGLSMRIFTKANVRQIFKPPAEYAGGRFGAARLVRGDLDLFVIVAYVWPEPSCVKERERNHRIWLYLDSVLGKVPHRSLPLLLLDASRFGVRSRVRQWASLSHKGRITTVVSFDFCWKNTLCGQ